MSKGLDFNKFKVSIFLTKLFTMIDTPMCLGAEANNVASNSAETNAPVSNVAFNSEYTALMADVERLKAENAELCKKQKAKTSKQKTSYNKVTEKFRSSFGAQVIKSAEAKKAVFEKSLKKTDGITREDFCKEFRDNVFDRMLVNIKFVSECIKLKVNPFEAAQFIVMNGNPTVDLVLKNGVEFVYGNSLDLLTGYYYKQNTPVWGQPASYSVRNASLKVKITNSYNGEAYQVTEYKTNDNSSWQPCYGCSVSYDRNEDAYYVKAGTTTIYFNL